MGRKMKFSFLSNANAKNSWQWLPSCHQPRTLSFRTHNNNTLFSTINSAYLDSIDEIADDDLPLETVIRGLKSDRLFFEPGKTSSIMEEATKRTEEEGEDDDDDDIGGFPFKESVALSMESRDPYVDFRESMEEMVEALGLKDWEGLEQLLFWYLRANGKCNHGYIIGAFLDFLVGRLAINVSNSKSDNTHSLSSALSFNTSSPSSSSSCLSSSEACSSTTIPCVSPLEAEKEMHHGCRCLSSSSPLSDQKGEMIIVKGAEDDDEASSSFLVV
ncbi:Transcription repressor OFP18 [Hibiscus syriacus]|uniref:Transcription repressor n=1 Tax=Hibiscus syriacus TaxID=106335 RepID=A0A6A3CNR9_HIBSY|nr:transcription repressor OFP13-like [Hibiscus syriacus]KAE8731125.1 Transcription repressor OFP18 [Hibiscus syriacus]